jgi:hypothetical protein
MKLPKLMHRVSVCCFEGAESPEAERIAFVRFCRGGMVFYEGG